MPSCSTRLISSRTCFHCFHVRFLCRHSKHLVFRSSSIAFDRILTFTSVNRTTFLPAFALLQNLPLFALWLMIFSSYYFFSSVSFQVSDPVILFIDMCLYMCACVLGACVVGGFGCHKASKWISVSKLFLTQDGNSTVTLCTTRFYIQKFYILST